MVLNKMMITTEDCNSILQHFGKGFVDFYTIDTRDISVLNTYFGYDFLNIIQTTNSFTFDVKNSLWTKGYRILETDGEDINVSITNNKLLITGTNLTYLVLELELSTIRVPFDSPKDIFYEVSWFSIMRPFYETNWFSVRYTDQDEPISNLLVYSLDMLYSDYTDDNGYIDVRLDPKARGNYTSQLRAYLDPYDSRKGRVDYFYPYQRFCVEFPVRLINSNVIRDKTNLLEFEFLFDDEYSITDEMLFGNNHIRLKVDGKYYEIKEYADNVFSFEVPIGSADKCNMELNINGNDYVDNYVLKYNMDTVYATFNSASALKSELESELSARTVIFNGNLLDTGILINKDITIIFDGVVTSSLDTVFTIDNNAVFKVDNANFMGKNFINMVNGSVELTDCSFNHCTSTIIKGTGDLTVDTCSFIDNHACVDVSGNVTVENSLFDLCDGNYLDNTKIPFLDVFGDLIINYCKFNIELSGLETLLYSYVCCRIGEDYYTNGVANKKLFVNESFPVDNNSCNINVVSDDYEITSKSNKAFTYTITNTNTVFSNKMSFKFIGD